MFGICHLNIIPVRKEKTSKSELVSQLLYGDLFTILKEEDNWYYVEILDDNYNGWINYSQLKKISEKDFKKLQKTKTEFLHNISTEIETFSGKMTISIGSKISYCNFLNHKLIKNFKNEVCSIEETARKYLNTPYLWGGKTPTGIDCSGLTQTIYRLSNIELPRDASFQAKKGKTVHFQDQKEGDLAFFENEQGHITHVGIIGPNQAIIHAAGFVKKDTLKKYGIWNASYQKFTHKLSKVQRFY